MAVREHEASFNSWWPADLQVLGKDIVRFHAVYWPAFLMASGLAMPKQLLVHGWIKVNDQKMSKSLGNVVDPEALYKQFGADPVRYYLMRYIAVTQDSSFHYEELEKAIASDLANDLGNLLNRAVTLAMRYGISEVSARKVWSEKATTLRDHAYDMLDKYSEYMDGSLFHMALAEVWRFINQINAYFHEHEPWKLIKHDRPAFEEVVAATCHSLYMLAYLLWPVMPEKMRQLGMSLGVVIEPHTGKNILEHFASEPWDRSFTLLVVPPLFIRPEPMKAEEKQEVVALQSDSKSVNTITIDDLLKVELVVGTIEQCEAVSKSDKLYKMQVNFGPLGMRQIVAGVRQHCIQNELIGKQAVFVVNLQPRKLLGLESQGMMLVAPNAEGVSKIVSPVAFVSNGTKLR